MRRAAPLALVAALALGCGGADPPGHDAPPTDAGFDAGRDAGVDAPDAAGMDAAVREQPPCRDYVPATTLDPGSDDDAGAADPEDDAPDALPRLESLHDFARLATDAGEVKYLVEVDAAGVPLDNACSFQNTRRFPFHLGYLRSLPRFEGLDPAGYDRIVQTRDGRVFLAGTLRLWPAGDNGRDDGRGVLTFTLFNAAGAAEQPTVADLSALQAALLGCMPFAGDLLAFLPGALEQQAAVAAIEAELTAAGVFAIGIDRLGTDLRGEIYSPGVSYGFLRLLSPTDPVFDASARDLIVADTAPAELPPVAGLVTARPQSPASHLNLRLAELGVVSASLPGVLDNAVVRALDGRLVRLTAEAGVVAFAPATLEEAAPFWDRARPELPAPRADLTRRALLDIEQLRAPDADAYGAKAANLGELHAALSEENRVRGFTLPFAHHVEHLEQGGLDAEVDALIDDPALRVDAGLRRARLSALRDRIRAAPLPDGLLDAFHARAVERYGEAADTTRLRLRSSTNAEDLDGLSGAGLYDSKSGCLADDLDGDAAGPSHCLTRAHREALQPELTARRAELAEHPERSWLDAIIADLEGDLTQERPVADALRKVWASLWNDRAFDHRELHGLDHRAVHMAVVVHPAFVLERVNAVAFTELAQEDSGRPLYRLISQRGELSVVRPEDPTALPEVLTFERGPADAVLNVTRLADATLDTGGDGLWSPAQLETLGALLFAVHDHFASAVYCPPTGPSLDVELKLTADGAIVIKQARPLVR